MRIILFLLLAAVSSGCSTYQWEASAEETAFFHTTMAALSEHQGSASVLFEVFGFDPVEKEVGGFTFYQWDYLRQYDRPGALDMVLTCKLWVKTRGDSRVVKYHLEGNPTGCKTFIQKFYVFHHAAS